MNKELQFLIYSTPKEDIKVDVVMQDETIWLTQKAIARLFDIDRTGIGKHLKNIFASAELDQSMVCANFAHTTKHGAIPGKTQDKPVTYYNLDAIISVGYRVNSTKATHFRIWATKILKEFIKKGFVLDDDRLKQGESVFGKDYFRELLDRIRSIRASERRIWQQITDIFAECSIGYDKESKVAKDFYAMVQNKFHFAITGQTAAEIIHAKADSQKDHMGLQTWKNSPDGRILKADVTVAKNYLTKKEIKQLERTVTGYFDYIEDLIERENTFTMEEFSKSINAFLTFRKYDVLTNKGKISKKQADRKATQEYNAFNKTQKIESDFDKAIKSLQKKGGK